MRWVLIGLAVVCAYALAYANEGTAAPVGGLSSAAPSTVTFTPPTIPADGVTTTIAAAFAGAASTDTVQFATTSGPCAAPGTATYNLTNSDWEATITATTTAGSCTIQASDTTTSATASGTLQQTPGPATTVGTPTFTTNPITADGSSTTTAAVTVKDINGNVVPGDSVRFNLGAPCAPATVTAAFNSTNQDYEATLTATTTAGNCSITATDTSVAISSTTPATLTQSPGTATTVGTPTFTTNPIAANGTANTTAAVTVTDTNGNVVPGDSVRFNLGAPCAPATVTAAFNSTNQDYEATLTATTTAGNCSITATDTSVAISSPSPAILTQTAQAASSVGTPSFSQNPITANGSAQTTASVRVTDIHGNPVPTESVQFNLGAPCAPAAVAANFNAGTQNYEATLTATTTAGNCAITATDKTSGISGSPGSLVQSAGAPAHLTLGSFSPSTIVANKTATTTAVATVSDAFGNGVPGAPPSITTSDPGEGVTVTPAGGGDYIVTVRSSTTAHAVIVTATEAGLSSSQAINQVHGPARSLALSLSSPTLTADGISSVTATMRVTDANGNPVSGDQIILGSTQRAVRFTSVNSAGNGVYTARVTSSNHPTTLSIIAADISVSPNVTGEATLTETLAPSLLAVATMQWTFAYHPTYTIVGSMQLTGAPGGASLRILCHGGGCPFAKRTMPILKLPICKRGHKRHCRPAGPVRLGVLFGTRHLRVGTKVTVEVLRTGWVGKYYSFKMRSGKGPAVIIKCLAPGGSVPGVGCS